MREKFPCALKNNFFAERTCIIKSKSFLSKYEKVSAIIILIILDISSRKKINITQEIFKKYSEKDQRAREYCSSILII